MGYPYSDNVNFKRDVLWAGGMLMLLAVAALGSGCGGLGASGSVSPATFLLPGLGQAEPQHSSPAVGEALKRSPEIAAYTSGNSFR